VRVPRFACSFAMAGLQPSLRSPARHGADTALSAASLRASYAKGLCLSRAHDRHQWSAPAERMVLFIADGSSAPSFRHQARKKDYRVTFDQDFRNVIAHCAASRPDSIPPDVVEAFVAAFDCGLAHSVEVRDRAGALIAGIFGLAIGRAFFTEGQFASARDAGNAAFAALNLRLTRGYVINVGKAISGRLCQLGFLPVPRQSFEPLLAAACAGSGPEQPWRIAPVSAPLGRSPSTVSALH
jgi:leucyl/phenylalanyl-tRNA--protein transferase